MSAVIGFLSNRLALMSSDSRGTNIDGTTIENVKKIFRVGPDILIGFTGSASVPEILFKEGWFDIKEFPGINPETYSDFIYHNLGKGGLNSFNSETNVLIFGKNVNEGFASFFHLDGVSENRKWFLKTNNEIFTPVLTPPSVNYNSIQQSYRVKAEQIHLQYLGKIDYIDRIKTLHYDFITEISKLDNSVDTNIKHKIILF